MRALLCTLLLFAAPFTSACPIRAADHPEGSPTAGIALIGDEQPTLAQALSNQERARCLQRQDPLAGYQKQTAFDNTPYRFNMKPGQKLNAEDFDAWMKSRGIRIVPAKASATATDTAVVSQ